MDELASGLGAEAHTAEQRQADYARWAIPRMGTPPAML